MVCKKMLPVLFLCIFLLCISSIVFASGSREKRVPESFDIMVFVPGVVAGSPIYEQLADGVKKAVAEYSHATVKIMEGGFNQGEWGEKLTSLAATGEYEIILTSNPAMPFIALEVMKSFPDQRFINVDAYYKGQDKLYTLLYHQVEQGYFVGYLGGLVTTSTMPGSNPDLKIGLIAGQEYPVLNKMIKPGYEKGAKDINPGIKIDFRIIGNWYDANKASDLANSMFDAGVDIILTIAGGANQGVIQAAKERGKYILYFDSPEYNIAPGTILGCGILRQDKAVYEVVKKAIEGKLEFGKADVVTTKEGFVDFADKDPLYTENVPPDIRQKMETMLKKVRSGELTFEIPGL
ncbi:MAG: BMP family ABC transporter substrate-binding protein [Spirochaetales bacterium]|nr:BMP family ABC transporter substrate-binding protein [Spirochaetales bacterium]